MKKLFTLFMVLLALLMVSCTEQITEGKIYNKRIVKETVTHEQRSKRNYKTVYFDKEVRYKSGTDKKGNPIYKYKTVEDTKEVFSHLTYAVYETRKGKDYIITIEKRSDKKDKELLKRKVYVTASTYNNVDVGDYYVTDRANDDRFHDANNRTKKVSMWTMWQHNLSNYPNK